MLPAKLFAGLAIIFSIFTGIVWLTSWPLLDLSLHFTYFVFAPMHLTLFCALTSINFAVLYYAGVRIFHARWNRPLSLLHFLLSICVALALIIVFVALKPAVNGPEVEVFLRWLVVPIFLGIVSVVVGLALFCVNLMLVVVQLLRTRFATR